MCGGTGFSTIDDGLNLMTQMATGGIAGFDEDGFGKGVTTDFLLEGIKDISGATAAEEANAENRRQFEEEKAKAAKDRQDAQSQSAQEQLSLSRQAGAARGGVKTDASKKGGGSRYSTLGSDEQDFLGL